MIVSSCRSTIVPRVCDVAKQYELSLDNLVAFVEPDGQQQYGRATAAATAWPAGSAARPVVVLSVLYATQPALGRCDAAAFGADPGQLSDTVSGIARRLVQLVAAFQFGLVRGGAVATSQ